MSIFSIAEEFSETPGGRYIKDGNNSAEELRQLLIPKVNQVKAMNSKLTIKLDGTYGYASSFLEETFGGLCRKYNCNISSLLILKSTDTELIEEINSYMENY